MRVVIFRGVRRHRGSSLGHAIWFICDVIRQVLFAGYQNISKWKRGTGKGGCSIPVQLLVLIYFVHTTIYFLSLSFKKATVIRF